MSADESYLVWSNEHRAWWGPNGSGYVPTISKAGRYSRTGALAICTNALGTAAHLGALAELPVRVIDLEAFLKNTFVPEGIL